LISTPYLFYGTVAVLMLLLVWALRGPRKSTPPGVDLASLGETCRPHASYLPQIRWALLPDDLVYLSSSGRKDLARRLRKDRRRVALAYLPAVKGDFQKMLRLARVIAGLSPEVVTLQEWERLRLTVQFYWRYQVVCLGLLCGLTRLRELNGLSQIVSGLAVRMESAMSELGERAALAVKLASSHDGRGVDVP
jgi:hypothetical protein